MPLLYLPYEFTNSARFGGDMTAFEWTTYKNAFFRQNINFRGRGRSETSHDYIMRPIIVQIVLYERKLIGATFK